MTAIGDQSPEGRDAKQARCDSTRAPVPNGQSPNSNVIPSSDLDALVERLRLRVPVTVVDARKSATAITSLRNQLTASEAREREMRKALEKIDFESEDFWATGIASQALTNTENKSGQ